MKISLRKVFETKFLLPYIYKTPVMVMYNGDKIIGRISSISHDADYKETITVTTNVKTVRYIFNGQRLTSVWSKIFFKDRDIIESIFTASL